MLLNIKDEYRPVPFWYWNDDALDEDEIKRQLSEFRSRGINEVIIMPGGETGLGIPFTSDKWWERVGTAAGHCRKSGMHLWLYDEDACPSGTCAGFVLKKYPWANGRGIRFEINTVPPGKKIRIERHAGFISAVLLDRDVKDVTHEVSSGGRFIAWRNNTGKKKTLVSFCEMMSERQAAGWGYAWSPNAAGYTDTLNPKAVRAFIDYFYEGAARRLSRYFGNTIKGVFTDEPDMGVLWQWLPFTPGLFELFRERYGYGLKERLSELVSDTGNFRRTRIDYWSLVSELFSQSYNRQICEWCNERNLLFTGHMMGEELLRDNVINNGELSRPLKYMHIPGIDILACATNFTGPSVDTVYRDMPDYRSFIIPGKVASSAARFNGRRRVLCESFGVCSWALTLSGQKPATDWLVSMGVNLIVDNLFPFSSKGIRNKTGGKSFAVPWWNAYGVYAEYASRLCRIESESDSGADIALLYPGTAPWVMFNKDVMDANPQPGWKKMQEVLSGVSAELLRLHYTYDFIFEDFLSGSRVEKGKLIVGDKAYSLLIIPSLQYLPSGVIAKVEEFALHKGNVLIIGALPGYFSAEGGRTDAFINSVKQGLIKHIKYSGKEKDAAFAKGLKSYLADACPPAIEIKGKDNAQVLLSRWVNGKKDIFFFSSQSPHEVDAEVKVSRDGRMMLLDLSSGKNLCELGKDALGRAGSFNYRFRPYESALLLLEPGKKASGATRGGMPFAMVKTRDLKETALSRQWQFSLKGPNIFLPPCGIRIDPRDAGIRKGWFRGDSMNGWAEIKNTVSSIPVTRRGSRFYWLRSYFKTEIIPDDIALVLDGESGHSVYVNGARMDKNYRTVVWTGENRAYPIAPFIRKGGNTITVRAEISPWLSSRLKRNPGADDIYSPEILAVSGSFSVSPANSVLTDLKRALCTGPWEEQGYPHYSGTATYTQDITAPALRGRTWIAMSGMRDAVRLWLNGGYIGIRAWEPYVFETTGKFKPGRNLLRIEVTNTLANVLRRYWRRTLTGVVPSGILGKVSIFAGRQKE